jgi:hypothetical protein
MRWSRRSLILFSFHKIAVFFRQLNGPNFHGSGAINSSSSFKARRNLMHPSQETAKYLTKVRSVAAPDSRYCSSIHTRSIWREFVNVSTVDFRASRLRWAASQRDIRSSRTLTTLRPRPATATQLASIPTGSAILSESWKVSLEARFCRAYLVSTRSGEEVWVD